MYARPGMLMKVRALVSLATTEKRIAHHGIVLLGDEVILGVLLVAAKPEAKRCRADEIDQQYKKIEGGEIRFHFTALELFCKPTGTIYAEKELPQPQPPVEFGFLKVNPEPCIEVT